MMEEPERTPPEPIDERDQHQRAEVWRGLGLTLLLHLIQIPFAVLTVFISLIFLGVTQLIYIIPAIVMARRRGRPGVVKGLIIGAALTFLLNVACSGFVLTNLRIQ